MVKENMVPKAVLAEMQNQMAMMKASLDKITKQNAEQRERIQELEQMLVNAQRARFGQHSEKSRYVLSEEARQLGMFDEECAMQTAARASSQASGQHICCG